MRKELNKLVSTLSRTSAPGSSEQKGIQLINELDLEPIVFKLTVSEQGEPAKMTLAEADAAVVLYRYFLTLNLLYPGSSIVPTRTIDEVWHTHILDTEKYAEDCQRIYGRMLHHFPYLGLRGPEDVERWHAAFQSTCELFEEHFGVILTADMQACGESCKGTLCDGGACDSGSCTAPPTPPSDRQRPRPERTVQVF